MSFGGTRRYEATADAEFKAVGREASQLPVQCAKPFEDPLKALKEL